jgi:hypothetical protein
VRVGAQIGQGTNNEAEYQALVAGLRHALRLGCWSITVHSDSLLVVKQMKGEWKVKDHRLKKLHGEATVLAGLFAEFRLVHVYREANVEADHLSHEIVYEEPTMPAPPAWGTKERAFHGWQAAAVRYWWQAGLCRSTYLLARIFNVGDSSVEQVVNGVSYKDADFTGLPAHV